MIDQISWETTYQIWQYGNYFFPIELSDPIKVETIHIEYKSNYYIYGFDWLDNDEAAMRKQIISNDPEQFLLFTKASNKGTIHTVQMLEEAKSKEERAAIWIAATAFELIEGKNAKNIYNYAYPLYLAALLFLRERFYVWHPSMRKLVPEIMIPRSVFDSIKCDNYETVMALIQMNTIMLKGTYSFLRYSSISEEEIEKNKQKRINSLRL